jgi:hypothetical protein
MSPQAKRGIAWAAAAGALALTWLMYTDPHFMVGLADQLWACF